MTKRIFGAFTTWLASVRAAVLRFFKRSGGKSIDIHAVSAAKPLWVRLSNDLVDELRIIADAEFESVADKPKSQQVQFIEQALSHSRNLLVRIADDVQQHLQKLITQAVDAGKTPAEIESIIESYLDATGSENWQNRARTIAITEVNRMANAGTQAAGMAISDMESVRLNKKWVTRHDTKVRLDHKVTDGQVVPLHSNFDVNGTPMLYPLDPAAPAEQVVNCRCSMKILDTGRN